MAIRLVVGKFYRYTGINNKYNGNVYKCIKAGQYGTREYVKMHMGNKKFDYRPDGRGWSDGIVHWQEIEPPKHKKVVVWQ